MPLKNKLQRDVVRILSVILMLIVVALGTAMGLAYYGLVKFSEPGQISADTIFTVPDGAGLNAVAASLELQDIIDSRLMFRFGANFMNLDAGLKRGEYLLPANASMKQILDTLVNGRPVLYQVTVPEGFTSWQVIERLAANEHLVGEIPEFPPEGSLLPDTYTFERGTERRLLLEEIRKAHDEAVKEIWDSRQEGLPISTIREFVILASIVEKETGVGDERPLVAAVFINRLKKGMRLQSDPTIIYGITGGQGKLGRGLKRSEIDAKNDYNTYQINGLPAGPISNPGRDALKAVANPAETDVLYFVADGSGGHVFAKTYAQHKKNVAAWRKIENARAKETAAEAEKSDNKARD